jgi:hypothetical protein
VCYKFAKGYQYPQSFENFGTEDQQIDCPHKLQWLCTGIAQTQRRGISIRLEVRNFPRGTEMSLVFTPVGHEGLA